MQNVKLKDIEDYLEELEHEEGISFNTLILEIYCGLIYMVEWMKNGKN